MKIKFINGKRVVNGKNVIWDSTLKDYVTGYFEVATPKYSWWRFQQTKVKTKIVIVKQKSILSMIGTLLHELVHWFTYKVNMFDKWIDR